MRLLMPGAGPAGTAPASVLASAYSLLLSFSLVLLGASLGKGALSLVPQQDDLDPLERIVFSFATGMGILGLAIASGLAVRTGILEGTVLAFREIGEWKFSLPVYIGDTIHVELLVEEVKPLPRLGGGSIDLIFEVKNQSAQTVMKGRWTVLVQSRPKE